MNAITKLEAAILVACTTSFGSLNASAWWDGTTTTITTIAGKTAPGTVATRATVGVANPSYGDGRTIIVYPQSRDSSGEPEPVAQLPR